MKYTVMYMIFLVIVGVSLSLLFLQRQPVSANSPSAALSFRPPRLVLSAMYHFQSGHLDPRSLIWVTQQVITRSNYSGPEPCLLTMLMDWAISLFHYHTLLSICCVVKPPFSCDITKVSAAHRRPLPPAVSAQIRTCKRGIWIVVASTTTDFCNQKASHHILSSQRWSTIEWSILVDSYSKHASAVLNILSRVMRRGTRCEKGVSKVLDNVSKVGRQGDFMDGLRGICWSGNNILAAIQRGDILLSII